MANLPPRPDHAFIGNHTYSIEWMSAGEWERARLDPEADALTYASAQVLMVKIHPGARETHYQELVLHEVTHAVWDATMLTHMVAEKLDDLEEFIIGVQAPGQLFVLKQNPALVKWLLSDGVEQRDE